MSLVFSPSARNGNVFLFGTLERFHQKRLHGRKLILQRNIIPKKRIFKNTHLKHSLSKTRCISVRFENLNLECISLDEAVTTSIVAQLHEGKVSPEIISIVRDYNLDFYHICKELTEKKEGLIISLDGIAEVLQSNYFTLIDPMNPNNPNDANQNIQNLLNLVGPVLRIPGVILAMTGRASDEVFKRMNEKVLPKLQLCRVPLFPLSHKDISDMISLSISRIGDEMPFRDALGLHGDEEVSDLAAYLLWHTGGVPGLVAASLDLLRSKQWLQNRTSGQTVFQTPDGTVSCDQ